MQENIRKNADLVVREMRKISGIDFGYTVESVAWLDGYVERQRVRPDMDDEFVDRLVSVLGSYLGECIIQCYGGQWMNSDGQWCVCFDEGNCAFPFNKIRKQFENGAEAGDSIASFFSTIPIIFATQGRAD
jgi:hypothetical protein